MALGASCFPARAAFQVIRPGDLESGVVRRTAVTAGLSVGDSRAFAARTRTPNRKFGFAAFRPSQVLAVRTKQADALGILRRPMQNMLHFITSSAAITALSLTDSPWLLGCAAYMAHFAPGCCMLVISLATRVRSINDGTAPASVLTPPPTPSGDMSAVVLLLWLSRGLLPASALLFVGLQGGIARATRVVGTAVTILAASRIHRLNATAILSPGRSSPTP